MHHDILHVQVIYFVTIAGVNLYIQYLRIRLVVRARPTAARFLDDEPSILAKRPPKRCTIIHQRNAMPSVVWCVVHCWRLWLRVLKVRSFHRLIHAEGKAVPNTFRLNLIFYRPISVSDASGLVLSDVLISISRTKQLNNFAIHCNAIAAHRTRVFAHLHTLALLQIFISGILLLKILV